MTAPTAPPAPIVPAAPTAPTSLVLPMLCLLPPVAQVRPRARPSARLGDLRAERRARGLPAGLPDRNRRRCLSAAGCAKWCRRQRGHFDGMPCYAGTPFVPCGTRLGGFQPMEHAPPRSLTVSGKCGWRFARCATTRAPVSPTGTVHAAASLVLLSVATAARAFCISPAFLRKLRRPPPHYAATRGAAIAACSGIPPSSGSGDKGAACAAGSETRRG